MPRYHGLVWVWAGGPTLRCANGALYLGATR